MKKEKGHERRRSRMLAELFPDTASPEPFNLMFSNVTNIIHSRINYIISFMYQIQDLM